MSTINEMIKRVTDYELLFNKTNQPAVLTQEDLKVALKTFGCSSEPQSNSQEILFAETAELLRCALNDAGVEVYGECTNNNHHTDNTIKTIVFGPHIEARFSGISSCFWYKDMPCPLPKDLNAFLEDETAWKVYVDWVKLMVRMEV